MSTRASTISNQLNEWSACLLQQGWCVIPDLVPTARVRALDDDLARDFEDTPFCTGGFYGERTKRFGRLLARSPIARELVKHPLVLRIAHEILGPWCDTILLNLTQALALYPGARPQLPHRDQDMWRGQVGEVEYLLNVMWPFTRYTRENGATVIWPRSHGVSALAEDLPTGEFAVELEPGSALLFLGSTLHGAGGNASNEVRRGAIISYCLGWLRTYENQFLAYPPEVARDFDPELAALVGYVQHRPNLGNFEGRCPSLLLDGNASERLGATDALRPDQEELLGEFLRNQHWPPGQAGILV